MADLDGYLDLHGRGLRGSTGIAMRLRSARGCGPVSTTGRRLMHIIRGHKAAAITVAIATAVFAGSIVSPAVGLPSLGKTYRIAKKALRTARSAKRDAKTA